MKNKFFILWLSGILSTAIALPYIFALQHEVIAKASVPLLLIGLLGIAQSAILLAVAIYFGLKLSKSIHLPSLITFESKIPLKENIKRITKLGIPVGIAVALVIKFFDIFFSDRIPQIATAVEKIPFWKALLIAPYGGVVEELLLRLFVMTIFVWLLGKITGTKEVIKNNTIMWVAILVSSILFGLGHLPATATVTQITPIVVVRAILLNGIGGVVFGWLYWKKGLEYSITAHFTADIVLHAILPALLK